MERYSKEREECREYFVDCNSRVDRSIYLGYVWWGTWVRINAIKSDVS